MNIVTKKRKLSKCFAAIAVSAAAAAAVTAAAFAEGGGIYDDGSGTGSGGGIYVADSETHSVGDFTVTGGTYETDYIYDSSGALAILTGTPLTIANTDPSVETSDFICITSNVPANITLAGVNINATYCALSVSDSADAVITLADGSDNKLTSGEYVAGIQKNFNKAELTIQCEGSGTDGHVCGSGCGKLTVNGGSSAAGIGGSNQIPTGRINISGGIINVTGGRGGSGIGGTQLFSNVSNITVSGGVVTAKGGSENSFGIGGDYAYVSTCTGLKVTGGSVKSTFTVTPTDESGNPVYPMIIPNPNGADVYIDGVKYSAANHSALDGDTSLYAYLTKDEHTVTVGGIPVYLAEIPNSDGADVYIDGVKYSASANRSVYDSDTNLYVYLTGDDHAVTINESTKIYVFENSAFEEMNVYFAPEFGIIPTEDGMTWDGDTKTLTLDNATVATYSNTADVEKVDIFFLIPADTTIVCKGENAIRFNDHTDGLTGCSIKCKGNLTIVGESSVNDKLDANNSLNNVSTYHTAYNIISCAGTLEVRSCKLSVFSEALAVSADNIVISGDGYMMAQSADKTALSIPNGIVIDNDAAINIKAETENTDELFVGDITCAAENCDVSKIYNSTASLLAFTQANIVIENGAISGKTSKNFSSDITAAVYGADIATSVTAGSDASDFFEALPDGLSASVKSVSGNTVTFTVSGIPSAIASGEYELNAVKFIENFGTLNYLYYEEYLKQYKDTASEEILAQLEADLKVWKESSYTVSGDTSFNIEDGRDFIITGRLRDVVEGEDYTYENGVLKILTNAYVTIKNRDPDVPTTDRIEVETNINVPNRDMFNIALAGVNIDVSDIDDTAAIGILSDFTGGSITANENTVNILKSGKNRAGINAAPSSGSLNIYCYGDLRCYGGENGAGIGSGNGLQHPRLIIESSSLMGKLTAVGGKYAAGIGGSTGSYPNEILISGININAIAGEQAAAIGGGKLGNNGIIKTLDSVITAESDVTAIGNGEGASEGVIKDNQIVFIKSSIKGDLSCTPVNSSGETLYLLELSNPNGETVYIDDAALAMKNHEVFGDTNLYPYVTGEDHTVKIGTKTTKYVFDPDTLTFTREKPSAPQNVRAAAGDKQVTLTWSAVENAEKYRVQRLSDNKWTTVATPAATSYTNTGLTNGTAYSYRVLTFANDEWSIASAVVTATPKASVIPQNVKATAGDKKITLTWSAVENAAQYRVQRLVGSTWTTVATPTATSCTNGGLTNGETYSYRVLALVDGKWNGASAVVKATPKASVIPQNVKATAGNKQVKVTWSAVENATQYRVQRLFGTTWKTVASPTATSCTNGGLTNGETYSYRVLALVDGKWNGASAVVKATPKASTIPQNVKATAGNKQVKVTWSAVENASQYRVQRLFGTTWKTVASPTATSYTNGGLTNGETYSYRVLALVDGKWNGASAVVKATPKA